MIIKTIRAFEVLNAQGFPALECVLSLEDGTVFNAIVPVVFEKSKYAAIQLYDGGTRYNGFGLKNAIYNIESIIAPLLIGKEPDAIQMDLDLINLDATATKTSLGANTLLAVSMCIYRAQSHLEELELFEFISYIIGKDTVSLPAPIVDIFKDDNLIYLAIPASASSFAQAMEKCFDFCSLFQTLTQARLKDRFMQTRQLIGPDNIFLFGLDAAAFSFFDPETRLYNVCQDVKNAQQMLDWYIDLVQQQNIYYLDNPFFADDTVSFAKLTGLIGEKCLIVGSDLFATHVERLIRGVEHDLATGATLCPLQVGTITEVIQAIKVCQEGGLTTTVAGENFSYDNFIADIAVGVSANFIRLGNIMRGDHNIQCNRLIEIEHYLVNGSSY